MTPSKTNGKPYRRYSQARLSRVKAPCKEQLAVVLSKSPDQDWRSKPGPGESKHHARSGLPLSLVHSWTRIGSDNVPKCLNAWFWRSKHQHKLSALKEMGSHTYCIILLTLHSSHTHKSSWKISSSQSQAPWGLDWTEYHSRARQVGWSCTRSSTQWASSPSSKCAHHVHCRWPTLWALFPNSTLLPVHPHLLLSLLMILTLSAKTWWVPWFSVLPHLSPLLSPGVQICLAIFWKFRYKFRPQFPPKSPSCYGMKLVPFASRFRLNWLYPTCTGWDGTV